MHISISERGEATLHLLCWYILSALLSVYNKHLLDANGFNFNYPLLISAFHAITQYLASSLIMFYVFPHRFMTENKRSNATWSRVIFMIAPTALCTALDIGLSNASLHYISLSFYTIIKSTVPVWVLFFAFLFGLERFSWKLVLIILIICAGVAFTVAGEVHFDWYGSVLVQLAAMSAGLRWSLTQMLMPSSHKSSHPLETINSLSPFTLLAFTIGSVLFETGPDGFENSKFFADIGIATRTIFFVTSGGVIALLMILSQFYFIKSSGAIAISVAGIFKVIFMIFVSMMLFGDVVTPRGLVGLTLSTLGIVLYAWLRLKKK